MVVCIPSGTVTVPEEITGLLLDISDGEEDRQLFIDIDAALYIFQRSISTN